MADLRKHEGFTIHRQGLDMDIVALRKVQVMQPLKPVQKPKQELVALPVQPGLFDTHTAEAVSGNGQPMSVVRGTSTTVDEQQEGEEKQHQSEASRRSET